MPRNPFDDEQRRRRIVLALGLLLLAVASTDWAGYRFGGSNHSIQLVWLKHLLDPTLYGRDPILDSFTGYATWFFHGLVPLVRAFGLEETYFVLYLFFHALTLAALYALARRLSGEDAAAALACILYLGQIQSLGAAFTFSPRLTHAHAAMAPLVAALYLHVSGRPRLASAVCGLTFNVHALHAAHVFALLSLDTLVRDRRRALGELLRRGAIVAALGAPTLLWILGRGDDGVSWWWPLWLDIMRERSGPHTFPSTVPGAVYVRYGLLLALGAVAVASRPGRPGEWRPFGFAAGTALLCLAGVLFSELWPVRRVIEAQLLRSSEWLTLVLLAYLGRLFVDSWRWGGLARAAAIASGVGLFVPLPGWTAVGLALYLLSRGPLLAPWAVAAGAVALPAAAMTGAAALQDRLGLGHVSDALQRVLERPAVCFALAGFVVLRASASWRWRDRAQPAAALALLAMLFGYVLPSMYRAQRDAIRAQPWHEVQDWARRATLPDAVFLTPPGQAGFRVFSERSVVVEWKDGTQQFFSAPFALGWYERIRDFGSASRRPDADIPPERLVELARKYRADYVVVRADRGLPFPRSFANDRYAVYRVTDLP